MCLWHYNFSSYLQLYHMHQLFKGFLLIVLLFTLSCGPDYVLDKTYDIKQQQWTYADTLAFEVDITDSLKIYNLYLDIEHSTEFSNQNLYVMIHTEFPSGKRISEKVSLEMANKIGVWFGDCNSEWCDFRIPIQQGAFFNALGKHRFTIEQYTRIDSLPGIKSLSFKIEDTGTTRG